MSVCLYVCMHVCMYVCMYIYRYIILLFYAQTLSLFTPQTLHPDILRRQKPQTWHHVFLPTYGRAEADDAQHLIIKAPTSTVFSDLQLKLRGLRGFESGAAEDYLEFMRCPRGKSNGMIKGP